MECGIRIQYEMRKNCSFGIALHRGRGQEIFLDKDIVIASHKAYTHGPGWRTAHANTIDKKYFIVYS